MNYSDEHKTLLFLPIRQGTRAIFEVFRPIGFIAEGDRPTAASHSLDIPKDKLDYNIIITKRHPYNRYLSVLKWLSTIYKTEYQSHDEICEEVLGNMGDYGKVLDIVRQPNLKYFIDTENIVEDITNIPLVKSYIDHPEVQIALERHIYNNSHKESERFLTQTPLPDYIKEKIYNRYKEYFEVFNYQP